MLLLISARPEGASVAVANMLIEEANISIEEAAVDAAWTALLMMESILLAMELAAAEVGSWPYAMEARTPSRSEMRNCMFDVVCAWR